MKFFALILILLVLNIGSPAVYARGGGDVGGGGMGRFELSQQERDFLLQQASVEEAFKAWKQLQDQSRQQKLMQDVFETLIVPQITNSN